MQKHSVTWLPRSLDIDSNYFVRQTYLTQASAFVTVKDEHKTCSCRKPTPSIYNGPLAILCTSRRPLTDKRYLSRSSSMRLITNKERLKFALCLLRLGRGCSVLALQAGRKNIHPNELLITGKLKILPIARIRRVCHVTFVQKAKLLTNDIPLPYSLQGAGDHWFITMGLESSDGHQRLVYLDGLPKGF
jgi:DNA (cytosine-5)-methyltransferase 1